MTPRSHVTIRHVANRAGVSHQTVSRVINASRHVAPETRQRVERAIEELGYRPNAIARSMAEGRTHTLACISPNLTDYTFASLIEGAEIEARQRGYFLLSASAPDAETFATLIDQLVASRRTEGLMVINPYVDQRYLFLPKNFPTVFLGARPRGEAVDSVYLDEDAAACCATEYLLSLGHTQIAHITGPLIEDCSQDRLLGYQAALKNAGIPFNPQLVYEGDWSATTGYQAIKVWCEKGVTFKAVFAQNDRMAVGAIRALHEAGLSVPEDISVFGYDDIPLASYFDPPLSTMRQDMYTSGSTAVQLLIRAVEHPESKSEQIRLPAELVIRSSTASTPIPQRR